MGIDYGNPGTIGVTAHLSKMFDVSAGIYLDNGSGGFTVENNVVYNAYAAMVVNPPNSYQYIGNTINVNQNTLDPHHSGGYGVLSGSGTSSVSEWNFSNNLLYCSSAALAYAKIGGSPTNSLITVNFTPATDAFAAFVSPHVPQGALPYGVTCPIIGFSSSETTAPNFLAQIEESNANASEVAVLNTTLQANDQIYVGRTYEYRSLTTTANAVGTSFNFSGADYIQLGGDDNSVQNYSLSLSMARIAYVYVLVDTREFSGNNPTLPTFSTSFIDEGAAITLGSSAGYLSYRIYKSSVRLSPGEIYTINMPKSNTGSAFIAVVAQYA